MCRLSLTVKPKRDHSSQCEKSRSLAFTEGSVYAPFGWLFTKEITLLVLRPLIHREVRFAVEARLVQDPRPLNWILIVIWGQWRFVQQRENWGSSGTVIKLWFSGLGLIQGQHKLRAYHRAPVPALLLLFFLHFDQTFWLGLFSHI